MTLPVGHGAALAAFQAAVASQHLHHAWLFTGPAGVGKASVARFVALRLLAEAQAPQLLAPGLAVPPGHPTRALIEAGSHPDFRLLARLPKDADKPEADRARSITIAQVRALQPVFATTPAMGARRVVLIDAVDDLERAGANALLKNLEEPPQGTIFLLISHAPGKLLPTIRSRCRLLRFGGLEDDDVAKVLRANLPDANDDEIAALIRASDGAPGRGLRYAGLDLAAIDRSIVAIAKSGDPTNAQRSALARALGAKAAQPRYEAFLERAPAVIARAAVDRHGADLATALDAHAQARDLAGAALGLSLDAAATVFEMSSIVARLAA